MEVHAASRGELRPDPAHDAVDAVAVVVRDEVARAAAAPGVYADQLLVWVVLPPLGQAGGGGAAPGAAVPEAGGGAEDGGGGGTAPSASATAAAAAAVEAAMAAALLRSRHAPAAAAAATAETLTPVADEAALLTAVATALAAADVDALVGYETALGSVGYLLERAAATRHPFARLLSRMPDFDRNLDEGEGGVPPPPAAPPGMVRPPAGGGAPPVGAAAACRLRPRRARGRRTWRARARR